MGIIAGAAEYIPNEGTKEKLLNYAKRNHTGEPDIYREKAVLLLQTDLPEGEQGRTMHCALERYTLVYSGEIFNAPELRLELTALGHELESGDKPELILHSYLEWGEDCPKHFNGVFAFAIWQSHSRKLFLVRDRIGVKPLFYARTGSGLLFASEIKALLMFPEVKPEIDHSGAAQLVLLGPGRISGSGVFRDIQELPPGYSAVFADGKLTLSQYWKLRDADHTESYAQTLEHVRWLLTDALRRQIQTDVPIGAFLSGGLDSSILCALMKQEQGSLRTFSVAYAHNDLYFTPGKFQPNSDGVFIEEMTRVLQSRHIQRSLTAEELADSLESATLARDLPGMGDIDSSFLLLCRTVQPYARVVISGECSDEIFGGYPWYRDTKIRNQAGFPWAQNTALRGALLLPDIKMQVNPEEFVGDLYEKTRAECDILPETDGENRKIKEMMNLNFAWFMQTLLDRTERMSLDAGIEVRVPYCDYRIAEYLYTVPWSMKNAGGREKGLLRDAMADFLPESVRNRKKSPYPKTYDPAYAGIVEERLLQKLKQPRCPLKEIVDTAKLQALLQQEQPWPWYGQLMQKPQIMAYFLQMIFWMEHYQVHMVP